MLEDYFSNSNNNDYIGVVIEGITSLDNYTLFEHMAKTHQIHHLDMTHMYQIAQAIIDKKAYNTMSAFVTFTQQYAPLTSSDQSAIKNKVLNMVMETMDSKMMTKVLDALRPTPQQQLLAIEWPYTT
jgi:hypothetical protein